MKHSAGLLLHRTRATATGPALEVLLGHPGGPLFTRRDLGVWSIPKGETDPGEDLLAAAYREFEEEIGLTPPEVPALPLGDVRLRSGKVVTVFAVEGDLDADAARSNLFVMTWPPGSGRVQEFPELDRAQWCDLASARRLLTPGQVPFLDRLVAALGSGSGGTGHRPYG